MADSLDRYGLAVPPDPRMRACSWCGARGCHAFEIVKPRKKSGTGQFVISCENPRHKELAEIGADPRKAEGKAA